MKSKSLVVFFCVFALALSLVLPGFLPGNNIDISVLGISTEVPNNIQNLSYKNSSLTDYENAIASLINNTRVANGLNALAADEALNGIADLRSQDMMDRNYFSHYSPENTNVFDLMRANGISFRYGGENLAQSAPASAGTTDGFLNAWLNSPTHKSNILGANYAKIGVSMSETSDRRVVTTVFTN
ncbi:MAG: CAP domain-containing protein [Actinomycetota bacterium]|nr:CAP domain-containing protein [Actinomycetota bacterium]